MQLILQYTISAFQLIDCPFVSTYICMMCGFKDILLAYMYQFCEVVDLHAYRNNDVEFVPFSCNSH